LTKPCQGFLTKILTAVQVFLYVNVLFSIRISMQKPIGGSTSAAAEACWNGSLAL